MSKQKSCAETSITEIESEILIDKLDRNTLSNDDKKVIAKVLRSYMYLATMIQQTGIGIRNVRDFFFGKKTNPAKQPVKADDVPDIELVPETADQNIPLTTPPPKSTKTTKPKDPTKPAQKGHGRLPASAYTGAEHKECHHEKLEAGMLCPKCNEGVLRKGKIKDKVRLHGHAPVSAIHWEIDTLVCNLCDTIFDAPLPENEATGKYNPSVKTGIALSRYYMGLPFNRLEQFQKMMGVPLPDSTQWILVEQLFNDVFPVIKLLIEMAAQSSIIHHDDTCGRILTLIEENKTLPKGARYGTHSTGFVCIGEQTIILFFTGRSHAGENLNKLLSLRHDDLPTVIQMSDASSSNKPKDYKNETIECFCNSHATRKFKDIKDNFPDACDFILEIMGEVFDNDKYTKLRGMSPEERRDYHAENSGPLMDGLKIWMEEQQEKYRTIEPNSTLGQSINYMLKRWDGFTQFLTIPGAPLDNNIVERALKRLIFQRKSSLFFANEYSAYVGCGLTSLIMTAVEAGINPFDYLNSLQENCFDVGRNPEAWLPWNYQETIHSKVA